MARSLWLINFLKRHFSLRFAAAELTKWPLIGPIMEHALFNGYQTGDALFYLPKDRVVVQQQIEDQTSYAIPSSVVAHFIEEANQIFLMDHCVCREAADCQDFDHDIGCIFLGEAVLDINPKLGRLVEKPAALAHLQRARDAGLVHLIGRDKIDAIWMGVTPSTRLMTICNCCPCCCLFKFLPNLAPKLQDKVERMPGVAIEVTEECIGCGECTQGVCFIDAIQLVDGKAVIGEDCRGCGNCVEACPQDAIRINIDDSEYVDTAIDRLSKAVDVH